MHVPNAQPPLPADWDVQPTHPVHRVPYQLAQFWDRGPRQRAQDRAAHLQAARKTQQRQAGRATGSSPGEVPRDLREAVKRSGGGGGGGGGVVRGWVSGLEEPVRRFLLQQQQQQHQQQQQNSGGSDSSEDLGSDDEQIVFAGRSDAMRDLKEKRERCKVVRREGSHEAADSGLVFDSLGDDESAAFKSVPGHHSHSRTAQGLMLTLTQEMAHPRHSRLLRPGVALRHPQTSHPPGHLRRLQEEPAEERPAPSGCKAAETPVGSLLTRYVPGRLEEASFRDLISTLSLDRILGLGYVGTKM